MHPRFAESLTRRQLLAAAASGAMIGSAWSAAFRDVTARDEIPAVTVARSQGGFGVLVELEGTRVLMIDAATGDTAQRLTELVTGLMKQRIDIVLATSMVLHTLPPTYLDRWRVDTVLPLPDAPDPARHSFSGQALRIGTLSITADSLPAGVWRADATANALPWYLSVAFGNSRLLVASNSGAARRLPVDTATVTGIVCNDPEIGPDPQHRLVELVAAPAESDLVTRAGSARNPAIVPLHDNVPVRFRLDPAAIELPSSYVG